MKDTLDFYETASDSLTFNWHISQQDTFNHFEVSEDGGNTWITNETNTSYNLINMSIGSYTFKVKGIPATANYGDRFIANSVIANSKGTATGANTSGPEMARIDEGKRRVIHMHRVILQPKKGLDIDHINGNRLDNRRINLRYATRSQNNMNRFARCVTSKSPYKGVCWRAHAKRWKAYIKINKTQIHIGYFTTAEKAAKAYNKAAIKYFGEFANLNSL